MINPQPLVEAFSNDELERALRDLLGQDLILISRVPGEYESTHPIEDVSVSTEEELFELVCKYSAPSIHPMTGHSRGVAYEAEIYRSVFPDPDLGTPVCYGTFPVDDGVSCLVLSNVPGATVDNVADPGSLVDACEDLAWFHARGVRRLAAGHNVFNRSIFSRLMYEMELIPGVSSRLKELSPVVIDGLSNAQRTMIHGELYPQNVLINDTGPVFLDWETAGVGPGSFDFALLTQGSSDPDLVAECEERYLMGRKDVDSYWGRRNLAAARIMAAGQLLISLRGENTDGVQEELALEMIGSQASVLRL